MCRSSVPFAQLSRNGSASSWPGLTASSFSVLARVSAPAMAWEASPRRAADRARARSSLSWIASASAVSLRATAFIHRAAWPVESCAHRVLSQSSQRRHAGTYRSRSP